MNFFKKIFGKKKQIAALPAEGKTAQLRKARKYDYNCECVISYDGNAVRRVNFKVAAYTRLHAEELIRKKLEIKPVRTYKLKR